MYLNKTTKLKQGQKNTQDNKTNDSSIFEFDKNGVLVRIKEPASSSSESQHLKIPEGTIGFAVPDCNYMRNLHSITLPSTLQNFVPLIISDCLLDYPVNLKNVINHSPVLFDWWVKNHKYGDKTLSEMETIDLEKYTNSDGKPFTIVSKHAFPRCFDVQNILFGNSIKRIDQQSFWRCYKLKNIQINNKDILFAPKAFNGISKSINFYVRDEQIKEKLEATGVDARRIFIKPIPKKELEEPKENKSLIR